MYTLQSTQSKLINLSSYQSINLSIRYYGHPLQAPLSLRRRNRRRGAGPPRCPAAEGQLQDESDALCARRARVLCVKEIP